MIEEIRKRILCMKTFPVANSTMDMVFSLSELKQIEKWHDEANHWRKIKELSGDLETPEGINEMHEAEVEKNWDNKEELQRLRRVETAMQNLTDHPPLSPNNKEEARVQDIWFNAVEEGLKA